MAAVDRRRAADRDGRGMHGRARLPTTVHPVNEIVDRSTQLARAVRERG
jgi:hypothetical protein